jgi:hypothetical protein
MAVQEGSNDIQCSFYLQYLYFSCRERCPFYLPHAAKSITVTPSLNELSTRIKIRLKEINANKRRYLKN